MKLVSWFQSLISYITDSMQHRYLYKYEGQKTDRAGDVMIVYGIIGKRGAFNIAVAKLYNDDEMLSNFSPLDVREIAAVYCENKQAER